MKNTTSWSGAELVTVEITIADRTEVARILNQAIAMGWELPELMEVTSNISFPGGGFGLVCAIDGRKIDEVTPEKIYLESPGDNYPRLAFSRWNKTHWAHYDATQIRLSKIA